MMKRATMNEWLKGFQVNNRVPHGLEISHLLYADDTLVLCEANLEQVRQLKMILVI